MMTVLTSSVTRTATPPPTMPSAGTGPKPKMSIGDNGTRSTKPTLMATEGTIMLPVPRSTLASAFMNHTSQAPANTMFE